MLLPLPQELVRNIWFCIIPEFERFFGYYALTPLYSLDLSPFVCRGLIAGAISCCRAELDTFADGFRKQHDGKGRCKTEFTDADSVSSILLHHETCPLVAKGKANLLGDRMSKVLESQNVKKPTRGSHRAAYKDLSQAIHVASLLRDAEGDVLVPDDLNIVDKRWLVRYLLAKGEKVCIITLCGIRKPRPDEIETPPPSPAKPSTKVSSSSSSSTIKVSATVSSTSATAPAENNKGKKRKFANTGH